jgi:hypothetical protein
VHWDEEGVWQMGAGTRKPFDPTQKSLVLRTDFSNDAAWNSVCETIRQFAPNADERFEFVNDSDYAGATTDELVATDPSESAHLFMFIADREALSIAEHPILVVDFYDEVGRSFRVIPSQIQTVEINLFLANMDFRDFADNADPDGVFRRFSPGQRIKVV